MIGARCVRNGSSTLHLPPLPSRGKVAKVWGMPPQQSPSQQWQILLKEWSNKACRFVSSRRTGLYVAAFLVCVSLLMLVNHLSRVSFHDTEKFHDLGARNLTQTIVSLPPPLIRHLPPADSFDQSLPPGHRCQEFTLPPPPADKKRTGPRPCPVCYLPVEDAIKLHPPPGEFPELVVKELNYIHEDDANVPPGTPGSPFGGYPTLDDRAKSYQIKESMNLHCGFVKGKRPGVGSGFDIDERDLDDMNKCDDVVVLSAIFANYDPMMQPKNISEQSKRNACFFMFVDEQTEAAIERTEDYVKNRKVGLWRVVTIHNLPYVDARRTGKIPKLLSHRLFPNARFSLWIDGKLELTVDPYQILERFLWRTNDTFAISRHYKRFDVFEEAEANKAGNKYNNASIDAQVDFYRREGLKPYSTAKLPLISDVPEGCVIIREHNPLTNLFTCLWFNEVDRFTSRDQLSFGIVRDKVIAQVPWRVNMFFDCERRNFVVQGYHRNVLEEIEREKARAAASRQPPPRPVSDKQKPREIRNARKMKRRDHGSLY